MKSIKLELTKFEGAVISDGFICVPLPPQGTGAGGIFHSNKDRVYVDCIEWENSEGEDAYGNCGSVQLSLSKDERDTGLKGAYIGNVKEFNN